MGCYVILNWVDKSFINIVKDKKGGPRLFDDRAEAETYGKEELNWNWKVVELELEHR